MAEKFDIGVIGSGPGGFRAAARCAARGAKVAMIEKEFVGGTCLNWGCIPSKTLLASAHLLKSAKDSKRLGIDIDSAKPDWKIIQQRKEDIIVGLRKAMTDSAKKMTYIQGRGVAVEPDRIRIESDNGYKEIQADKLIIATGSAPRQIPGMEFDGQTVISSREALSLDRIPESMIIIGGGIIGCEMASVYAVMGTKVTIVETMSELLPMEDAWVGRSIAREFKRIGIKILTDSKVVKVDKHSGKAKVKLETGEELESEKVLVAVGRKATCDQETIDNLKLKMNGPVIDVNNKLETNVPGVYALGDVVGTTYLAHGATTEGNIVAINATGGKAEMKDYTLIPSVIYTFPEVASVGRNEKMCCNEGLDAVVGKGFWRANGRAVAHSDVFGEIRVTRNKATNKIEGITMTGSMATEMIGLATMMIGKGPEVNDITFAHPTFTETLQDATEDAFSK